MEYAARFSDSLRASAETLRASRSRLGLCSSALTQDIYKQFLHKRASDKELVWLGRAMVFAIAVIAILIVSALTAGHADDAHSLEALYK